MFFDRDLKGNRLPLRTLCLTYDDGPGEVGGDGPGPHTLQLGRYLFEQGIRAAFFVVGRHAESRTDILAALKAWGHLVANHTYSHPGLVALATAGGDVVGEVARTHAIIRDHVADRVVFFRAPYGNWRQKRGPDNPEDMATSVVAEILNRSAELRNYVGPVNWDISAADYDYWKRGASARACAQAFLKKIARLRRGIVLMHDSSEEQAVRGNNRALQTTRLLVPALQGQGYRFIGLDAIPQLRSAVRVCEQVTLRTREGKLLALRDGDDELLVRSDGEAEVFGLVPLAGGRVALRAGNGQYLSVARGGAVHARGSAPGERESLAMEESGGGVVLRTASGPYLRGARDGSGRLFAAAASRRAAEVLLLRRRFPREPARAFRPTRAAVRPADGCAGHRRPNNRGEE